MFQFKASLLFVCSILCLTCPLIAYYDNDDRDHKLYEREEYEGDWDFRQNWRYHRDAYLRGANRLHNHPPHFEERGWDPYERELHEQEEARKYYERYYQRHLGGNQGQYYRNNGSSNYQRYAGYPNHTQRYRSYPNQYYQQPNNYPPQQAYGQAYHYQGYHPHYPQEQTAYTQPNLNNGLQSNLNGQQAYRIQ
jgi:hypothetical protein